MRMRLVEKNGKKYCIIKEKPRIPEKITYFFSNYNPLTNKVERISKTLTLVACNKDACITPAYLGALFNNCPVKEDVFKKKPLPVTLRPYQAKALATLVEKRYVILKMPTGSGKTIVAAAALAWAECPSLVLVPTVDLKRQWLQKLRKLGMDAGEEISRKILVTTYQSFRNHHTYTNGRCFLVLDEAHHVAAPKWIRFLLYHPWSSVLALTATPKRSDGNDHLFSIFFKTTYSVSYEELARQGYLSKLDVFLVLYRSELPPTFFAPGAGARALTMRVLEPVRLELISELAAEEAKEGSKVIVFAERIEEAENLKSLIEAAGAKASIIHSRLKKEKRARELERFKNNITRVLVATSAAEEGVDIPDADVVITPPVSARRMIQRMGRALRPKNTTAKVYVISSYYEIKHAYRRLYSALREAGINTKIKLIKK